MGRNRSVRMANTRLIETEIRNYHDTRQVLRDLEDTIIQPGAASDPDEYVPKHEPGDPTPSRAVRLMTSATIAELRRRVAAIEYMLTVVKASPESARYEMLKLAYWDNRYTVEGICDQLKLSRATYYRWRREMLQLVAEKLGWEV